MHTTQLNKLIREVATTDASLNQEQHIQLLENNRPVYASLLRLPNLKDEDIMKIIQNLLAVTEYEGKAVGLEMKRLEDFLIGETLLYINPEKVLESFADLVLLKVNNQCTAGWIKSYILGSPNLETWAVNHRRKLAVLLRHAMGKQVAQTCVHFLGRENLLEKRQVVYLNKNLYKYANPDSNQDNYKVVVAEVFLFIFRALKTATSPQLKAYLETTKDITKGENLPYRVLKGLAATYHKGATNRRQLKRLASSNKAKRDFVVGVDAGAKVSLIDAIRSQYLNGSNPDILAKIEAEVERIPNWDAKVAVILDTSFSMKGSGARAYNNLAIGIAFTEILKRTVRDLTVIPVGNSTKENYPIPQNGTNLANALVQALETKAEVILVISDGYENIEQGDALQVLEGAKALKINTPIFHILPAFTEREAFEHRRPLGDAPIFLETGERGFLPLWLRIQFTLNPDKVATILTQSIQPNLN